MCTVYGVQARAAGTASCQNKTLPQKRERNERVATDEDEAVVSIPMVIRIAVVAVEPQLVLVVFDVEHVEVAVRVRCIWRAACATTP